MAPNEVPMMARAWRKNGGKVMRMIREHLGEDCYRLRYERYADVHEPFRTVIVFNSTEEAVVYRLLADRCLHEI